jgi:tetratricopeptide (TPR) repeat protein
LYQAWGKPGDAEPAARRAWEIFSRESSATEEDHGCAALLLSAIYFDTGRRDAAEALLQELQLRGESRLVLRAYNDLGTVAIHRGDLESAESFVRRAAEMAPRVLPESHPLRAATLNNLAQIQRFQQRYLEAEQNYRQAIAIWEATLGPRHPDTAKGMLNLAALNHERGREAAAEELYRRAVSIFHDAYGDHHELTLIARAELAEVLRAERRFSESERLTLATLPALEDRLGPADPRVVRALGNYQRLVEETRR